MDMMDMGEFRQPGMQYRIHPFWFWNGEMDDAQIRSQINEMHEKGVGGFFLCARQGLTIPYLSQAWFDKVRLAVEYAGAKEMQVWLYDEYPYPSGIAGGEVILEHPEAKHVTLEHQLVRMRGGERVDLELPWGRILYARAAPVLADGTTDWEHAVDVRHCIGNHQADPLFQKTGLTTYTQKRFFTYRTVHRLQWEAPEGEWMLLVFQEQELDDFKYYGTFVDPCNREAMDTFIRLTHEKYVPAVGDYFGTTVKGMFTDEIALLGRMPWSRHIAASFRARCGYELIDQLHALVDRAAADAAKVRYDYYQTIHLLLRGSYHQQVHDWCERQGLHYVAEVPVARMTTQAYSHVPGGDSAHEKLGRSLDWSLRRYFASMRENPKMISSLSRQLRRERNLVECFHSVGWTMTLQDARWMIDRLAALGTNFYNFHAFYYTMDALAKHDAPPSQFVQNPYWAHFRLLGDYTGRLSYIMSQGRAHIRIAYLDPTTTFWSFMANPFQSFRFGGVGGKDEQHLRQLREDWMNIGIQLLRSRLDYDHLDPELLADADVGDGLLRIGWAEYSVIVLPPLTNLEGAAWRMLQRFKACGGTVIALGLLPHEPLGDGGPSGEEALQLFGAPSSAQLGYWSGEGDAEAARGEAEAAGEPRREPPLYQSGNAYYLPYATGETAKLWPHLARLLERVSPPAVRLRLAEDPQVFLMQTRVLSGSEAAVFVTNQEGGTYDGLLELDVGRLLDTSAATAGQAQLLELCLETGSVRPWPAAASPAGATRWSAPLRLEPYAARLLLVRLPGAQAAGAPPLLASAPPAGGRPPASAPSSARGPAAAGSGSPEALAAGPLAPPAAAPPIHAAAVPLAASSPAPAAPPALGATLPTPVAPLAPAAAPLAPERLRLQAQGSWALAPRQGNTVRLGEFELQWRTPQGPAGPWRVPAKTFIDQCSDLEAQFPASFNQTFGTPMKLGLRYPLDCVYTVSFEVEQLPDICMLVMDQQAITGERAICVNGHTIPEGQLQPYHVYDYRNIGCPISRYLVLGHNELRVDMTIRQDFEGLIDPLYLQGSFGVELQPEGGAKLTAVPRTASGLRSGVVAGYPYYAGSLSYSRSFHLGQLPETAQFELEFSDWDIHFHDCCEVFINGVSLGVRPWTPYRWQGETQWLRAGANELEVVVTGTLAAMLDGNVFDYASHTVQPVQSLGKAVK